MRKCIVHIGSPKTGTTSIQATLKKNRSRFLKQGILVPTAGQSGKGVHPSLAHQLAGLPVRPQWTSAEESFVREIKETDPETILISAEALWRAMQSPDNAELLVGKLRALNLDVSLLCYVRNQPQVLNSSYGQGIKTFLHANPFSTYVNKQITQGRRVVYTHWIEIAQSLGVELIARPFSAEVRKVGLIDDFLRAVGVSSPETFDRPAQLNQSVSPFHIAVARALYRRTMGSRKPTLSQQQECIRALRKTMEAHALQEASYMGLTTELAGRIQEACRDDDDRFAEFAWGRSWAEVFSSDIDRPLEANDYDVTGVPEERRDLFDTTVSELASKFETILAVETPDADLSGNARMAARRAAGLAGLARSGARENDMARVIRRLALGRTPELRAEHTRTSALTRRCILHIGPPKSGTSSIQHALKTGRKLLLKHGIFVPKAGRMQNGSHLSLAQALAGLPTRPEDVQAVEKFEAETASVRDKTIVISSEHLWPILSVPGHAARVLGRLRSLNLDVSILLYVRSQPQHINSSYVQGIKTFRHCSYFQPYVAEAVKDFNRFSYARWVDFAELHNVRLIARPFTKEVQKAGLIQDFLETIEPSIPQSLLEEKQRNQSVGPLAVAVARKLLREIGGPCALTLRQAGRCSRLLRQTFEALNLREPAYCGLTTEIAAGVAAAYTRDNERLARACWSTSWAETFQSEPNQAFESNDITATGMSPKQEAIYRTALAETEAGIREILADRELATETPWNHRLGDLFAAPQSATSG